MQERKARIINDKTTVQLSGWNLKGALIYSILINIHMLFLILYQDNMKMKRQQPVSTTPQQIGLDQMKDLFYFIIPKHNISVRVGAQNTAIPIFTYNIYIYETINNYSDLLSLTYFCIRTCNIKIKNYNSPIPIYPC